MKRLAVIAHEKNDVIASEIDDENDTYSMLKLKILSTIKFIRSRKKRADIESMYDQVMKTNSPKLQISSIDEVLSKLIDHNLVSNKKTSAGLDSFRMLTEEPVDDQIYFSILDRDKKSSEQLSDDSQGIPDSCQINVVPPINTSILDISTEFVTENQDMEKIEAQLIAIKSYIKCEISNIDQKIKSLYECFNGVKETETSNEVLQKNVTFLQNELIRKNEVIKSFFETETFILETVSKPSLEGEKKEEEVSPTRNEIIEDKQWKKQSSGKKDKNGPKNIYIGNLSLDTQMDDIYV